MHYHKLSDEGPSKLLLLKMTSIAAIGGLLFGYDTGVIGGANLYMYQDLGHDDPLTKELVVSMAIAGAVFGPFLGSWISDAKGRKLTILLSDVLFFGGAGTMALATSIMMMVVGRFIVGVGVGMAAMIVPIYLAEISPPKYRGIIVGANTLFTTGGQLISILACLAMAPSWRWMLGIAAVPAGLQVVGMLFMPESPRWLAHNGQLSEAAEVMREILGGVDQQTVQREIQGMIDGLKHENNKSWGEQFKLLFTKYRKQTILGNGLQALQQLCGINTAMYYGPQIMQMIGFDASGVQVLVCTIPIAALNFLGSIIALAFIDNLGRRGVLLRTLPGIVVSMVALSLGSWLTLEEYDAGRWISLISILGFIMFFSLGMGPIPWTVNSEIYPIEVKNMGVSMATCTNWVSNFLVSMTFLSIASTDTGFVLVWSLLGICGAFAWIWTYFLLPETNGRSLEEITAMFKQSRS